MVLNDFYLSLPPGLSKESAYRLNVTRMSSATETVMTKKIFHSHKPYILSQKAFKVAPASGATLNTPVAFDSRGVQTHVDRAAVETQ